MPEIVTERVNRNSHDHLDKITAFDLSFLSEQASFWKKKRKKVDFLMVAVLQNGIEVLIH